MADIFLSYASEDLERVRPLVERLEERDWQVWWDREIPIGKTWPVVIEEALEATTAMVVVWTEASVESKWVRIETTKGEERGGLVPVKLDDIKIPIQFSLLQTADLTNWDGSSSHVELKSVFSALEAIFAVSQKADLEAHLTLLRSRLIVAMNYVQLKELAHDAERLAEDYPHSFPLEELLVEIERAAKAAADAEAPKQPPKSAGRRSIVRASMNHVVDGAKEHPLATVGGGAAATALAYQLLKLLEIIG